MSNEFFNPFLSLKEFNDMCDKYFGGGNINHEVEKPTKKELGNGFSLVHLTDEDKNKYLEMISDIINERNRAQITKELDDAGFLYYNDKKICEGFFKLGNIYESINGFVRLKQFCIKTYYESFEHLNIRKGDAFLSTFFVIINYKGEIIIKSSLHSITLLFGRIFIFNDNVFKLNSDDISYTNISSSINMIETEEFYFVPIIVSTPLPNKMAKISKADGSVEYYK